jgi:hypothetical protein
MGNFVFLGPFCQVGQAAIQVAGERVGRILILRHVILLRTSTDALSSRHSDAPDGSTSLTLLHSHLIPSEP